MGREEEGIEFRLEAVVEGQDLSLNSLSASGNLLLATTATTTTSAIKGKGSGLCACYYQLNVTDSIEHLPGQLNIICGSFPLCHLVWG